MYFLQADAMARILIACVVMAAVFALARHFGFGGKAAAFLLLPDLLLLLFIDWQLAAFYAGYTCLTYGLTALLREVQRGRKIMFPLFCLFCAAPFFVLRISALLPDTPKLALLTGIAYNMLKAIDALFYVYYSGERVDFLPYANFLLFFPVFTAGPIYRYRDFIRDYAAPKALSARRAERFTKRLILGLFKKLVILRFIGKIFARLMDAHASPIVSALLLILSYVTVYLDLSGYSDIAIALGGFVGFDVPENFKKPLEAASFTQFWRKWHVTLSDWIREHIFVLAQGKKLKRQHSALIGLGTMIVMSLWHDFAPLDALSGVYMGILIAGENLLGLTTFDKRRGKPWVYTLRRCIVAGLFAVNAMLFLMPMERAISVLRGFLPY